MNTYNITSLNEMDGLAARLIQQVRVGEVWLLTGELGSGKTTFVQGVAKALGVKEKVTSPTFTIVGEYEVPDHDEIKRLVHVDLYRLESEQARRELAVHEALEQVKEGALVVVEWADRLVEPRHGRADKLGEGMSEGAKRLEFKHGGKETERVVIIK